MRSTPRSSDPVDGSIPPTTGNDVVAGLEVGTVATVVVAAASVVGAPDATAEVVGVADVGVALVGSDVVVVVEGLGVVVVVVVVVGVVVVVVELSGTALEDATRTDAFGPSRTRRPTLDVACWSETKNTAVDGVAAADGRAPNVLTSTAAPVAPISTWPDEPT